MQQKTKFIAIYWRQRVATFWDRKGDEWYPGSRHIGKWSVISKTEKYGYIEVTHTPGYWKHIWKPTSWTLILDDFGFKYTNKQFADELLKIMSQWYVMKMDWECTSFGGITLKWNYEGERWVELFLPGYIDNILARFSHTQPKRPQESPHPAPPTKFTRTTPAPPSPDEPTRTKKKE